MLAGLYDETLALLFLTTAVCAAMMYPALGTTITVVYIAWTLSFFITQAVDNWVDKKVARTAYTLSFLAPGFTAILTPIIITTTMAASLIALYTGGTYFNAAVQTAVIISLALSLYAVIKAFFVTVREETIDLGLDQPLTLAHCSDIHLGATIGESRLNQVQDIIQDYDADYTLISGDVFDGSGWPRPHSLEPIRDFADAYASLGNHDYYYGDQAEPLLDDHGVTVLRNDALETSDLRITGVDDKEYPDQAPAKEIERLDKSVDKPSILLYHRPEELDVFTASDYDVLLAGHTHGGQIYSMRLLARIAYTYLFGLFHANNKYVNVSSGAGTGGPLMRLGTTNEVCILTLT